MQRHEAVASIAKGQRSQHQPVHDSIDNRIGADTQREGRSSRQSKTPSHERESARQSGNPGPWRVSIEHQACRDVPLAIFLNGNHIVPVLQPMVVR